MMDFVRVVAVLLALGMTVMMVWMGIAISHRDDLISWMGPPLLFAGLAFASLSLWLALIENHLEKLVNKD